MRLIFFFLNFSVLLYVQCSFSLGNTLTHFYKNIFICLFSHWHISSKLSYGSVFLKIRKMIIIFLEGPACILGNTQKFENQNQFHNLKVYWPTKTLFNFSLVSHLSKKHCFINPGAYFPENSRCCKQIVIPKCLDIKRLDHLARNDQAPVVLPETATAATFSMLQGHELASEWCVGGDSFLY